MAIKKINKVSVMGLKEGYSRQDYYLVMAKAENLLYDVFKDGEPDKKKVALAVGLYHEAISINTAKIEPYLALAYISWKFGDKETAKRWLKNAYELEPKNKKIDVLLNKIQNSI